MDYSHNSFFNIEMKLLKRAFGGYGESNKFCVNGLLGPSERQMNRSQNMFT